MTEIKRPVICILHTSTGQVNVLENMPKDVTPIEVHLM